MIEVYKFRQTRQAQPEFQNQSFYNEANLNLVQNSFKTLTFSLKLAEVKVKLRVLISCASRLKTVPKSGLLQVLLSLPWP